MESKRYNNSFTSSSMVKEEGRTAYYKLLDSVRDGDAVRIKRGVYATAEQLADTMIDVEAIIPGGVDRKSTRLNSSHSRKSRMPSSA